MDINLDDVLETWFGKSETSVENINIDAFLIDAMFAFDFNVVETPDSYTHTEEEGFENTFKEDMQPLEFPLSCNAVSIPEWEQEVIFQ